MRRAARKDRNHNAVRDVYAGCGWSVRDTHQVGKGFPDILVAKHGYTKGIEVKFGNEPLTPAEELFHEYWQGEITIIRSVEEAIADASSLPGESEHGEVREAADPAADSQTSVLQITEPA